MVDWFWRRRRRTEAPRLPAREDAAPAMKIDLHEFTPAPDVYLAKAAYVELTLFEGVSRAATIAPTTAQKSALAAAADAPLERHRALLVELERLGEDAGAAMDHDRAIVDRFQRLTQGQDWLEASLTCHLAGGFLGDLFRALAAGLPPELEGRVRVALAPRSGDDAFAPLLARAMEEHPRLPSRLALWGRRVLGDALLVARDALDWGDDQANAEQRVEPAFSELIAEHTRRMDALGLSA